MKTVLVWKDSCVALVATLLLIALMGGCSDDCPTCPKVEDTKHYKGWLYYTEQADGFSNVYKVDMETDSIVDSITYNPTSIIALGMDVSPDGRYLVVGFSSADNQVRETRVYDAQTLQLVTVLPKLYDPFFNPGSGMLVGAETRRLTWFDVPSFQIAWADTFDIAFSHCSKPFDISRHLIYGNGWTEDKGIFCKYNYAERLLTQLPDFHVVTGDTVQPFRACFDSQRNRLFFKSLRWLNDLGPAYIMGCDLSTNTVMWSYPTMCQYGYLAVSPDGSEVWMTDPGLPGYVFDTGTIFVFNAATGAYLQGISLFGYGPNPLIPLAGASIIFSPTGEKAYVATGFAADRATGSIMVVDTKLKKITKVLTPDYLRSPMVMCIGPKI